MTRFVLIILAIFLFGVTGLGIYAPDSLISSFLTLSQPFTGGRIAFASCILVYGAFKSFRLPALRSLIGIAGVAALGMGTVGMFFLFMLPIDIFVFLSSGIFALLAHSELEPTQKTWQIMPKLPAPSLSLNGFRKNIHILTANKAPQSEV